MGSSATDLLLNPSVYVNSSYQSSNIGILMTTYFVFLFTKLCVHTL